MAGANWSARNPQNAHALPVMRPSALMAPFSSSPAPRLSCTTIRSRPFAHADGAARVRRPGPDAPAGKDYEKPEFADIAAPWSTASRWRALVIHEGVGSPSRSAACCASSASPTTAVLDVMKKQLRCWSSRRSRPPLRCCARPCARMLQDHKVFITGLDRCAHRAGWNTAFHLDDYVAMRRSSSATSAPRCRDRFASPRCRCWRQFR